MTKPDDTQAKPGNSNSDRTHKPDSRDEDPGARAAWFRQSRLDARGRPLRDVFLRGALKAARMRHKTKPEKPGGPGVDLGPVPPPGVNWTPLGPSIINSGATDCGRVTAVVAGPGGTRVYAGAADGGVWISTDSGASWIPVDDYFTAPGSVPGGTGADIDSVSTGAIEIRFGATAADDEIFIGTGEANHDIPAIDLGDNSPVSYFGVGIRHRAGGAWSLEATNLASQGIYRMAIDPNDVTPVNVYAATTAGLFKRPTSGSMTNWNLVTVNSAKPSQPVTDFVAAGSGTGRLFYAALHSDTVYSSPDGVTWTPLSGLGTLPNNVDGRIALAASESSPNIIFAMTAQGNLFRLDSSIGTVFQPVLNLPAGVPLGGQGWYDIAIAVDPLDSNSLYLGGMSFYKGTLTPSGSSYAFPAGGPTWVGAGVHSDLHSLAFALKGSGSKHDPTNVWVGCDGGVYQSTASGAPGTFQPRHLGLAITQCFSVGQRADTDAVVIMGTQDNGGPRVLSEQAASENSGTGDGGNCVFHPADPYRAMMQYKRTGLVATTDGASTWSPVTTFPPPPPYSSSQNSENSGTLFIAPVAAIKSTSAPAGALFVFGTNRLWLTEDWGATWVTLPTGTNPYSGSSPDLTQDLIDPTATSSVTQGASAVAFASPKRIYAATALKILRYDKSGTSWSTTPLPTSGFAAGYYITAIASEDAAAGTLYITMGGAGNPHVYYWDGSAWHAAMPTTVVDVPVHAVAVDPVTKFVYAGTDVGCWKGVRSGTTWTWSLFSDGLPQAAILQLAIHEQAHLLRAATCGRGIWEIPLDSAAVGADPDIYLRVNYADSGRLSSGKRQPWVEGAADPTNPGLTLYHWMSADIKVRRSSLSGLPPLSSPPNYLDFAFNIGDYVQSSTDIETVDVSGTDRIFVEIHNRSVNPVAAANVRVLLLVADASAALPPLPAGWKNHVNSGDTSSAWLSGSQWHFVDPAKPYHPLPGVLDVRTPQVVEYDFDFSTLGLPAGHDHVCLAAFITTVDLSDRITSTNTDLNTVTMTDKHVAHRNLHLVALGTKPLKKPHPPKSIVLNFHNPYPEAGVFDLVFERHNFPGEIALLLPKLSTLAPDEPPAKTPQLSGFRLETGKSENLSKELEEWIETLGKSPKRQPAEDIWSGRLEEQNEQRRRQLALIDLSHILRADASADPAKISGVHIPARGTVTAVFALRPPPGAKKNDRYRLDVAQHYGHRLLGGSSYVVAMV